MRLVEENKTRKQMISFFTDERCSKIKLIVYVV